jgi:hypothetical protein
VDTGFSEKIMLKQEDRAWRRFEETSSRSSGGQPGAELRNALPTVAGRAACMSADLETAKQVQEQTQIIASAIGKPAAKAPIIVTVNAKTRFASGRTLSNDMSLTPPRGSIEKPPQGRIG